MRKDYHYVLYGEVVQPIEPMEHLLHTITYSPYDVASTMVVVYGHNPATREVKMLIRPRNPDW